MEVFGQSASVLNAVYAFNAFGRLATTLVCGSKTITFNKPSKVYYAICLLILLLIGGYIKVGSSFRTTFSSSVLVLAAIMTSLPFASNLALLYLLATVLGIANSVIYISTIVLHHKGIIESV